MNNLFPALLLCFFVILTFPACTSAEDSQEKTGLEKAIDQYPFYRDYLTRFKDTIEQADLSAQLRENLVEEYGQKIEDLKALLADQVRENFKSEAGKTLHSGEDPELKKLLRHQKKLAKAWMVMLYNRGQRISRSPAAGIFTSDLPIPQVIRKLDTLRSIHPDDPEVQFYLARSHYIGGELSRVIPLMRKAVELDSTFAEAHYYLATYFEQTREFGLALMHAMNATQLDTLDPDYALFAGSLLLKAGRPQDALSHFHDARTHGGRNFAIFYSMARAYKEIGDPEQQQKLLEKSLNLLDRELAEDSLNTTLLANQAMVLGDMGKKLQTLGIYNQILALDSLNEDALFGKTYLHIAMDSFEAALEGLQTLNRYQLANYLDYNMMGFCLIQLGKYDEAIPWLEKAIDQSRNFGYPFANLGYIFTEKKDYKKAWDYLTQAKDNQPRDPFIHKQMAWWYLSQGDQTEGCAYLDKASQLGFKARFGAEVERLQEAYCR